MKKTTKKQRKLRKCEKGLKTKSFNRGFNRGFRSQLTTPGLRRIPTGLHMCPEEDYYIEFVPRSGMAYKDNLIVTNTPATCDENYSGKCMVLLHNQKNKTAIIHHDERIAQMREKEHLNITLNDTNVLDNEDIERGSKGFGKFWKYRK